MIIPVNREEGEEKFNDQGIIKELVCIHACQEDECLPILKIDHFITVPFVELARYMILRIGFHIGELRVVKQNVIAVHLHPDDFLTADPFSQPVRVFRGQFVFSLRNPADHCISSHFPAPYNLF